jgi:hypothetical protein
MEVSSWVNHRTTVDEFQQATFAPNTPRLVGIIGCTITQNHQVYLIFLPYYCHHLPKTGWRYFGEPTIQWL